MKTKIKRREKEPEPSLFCAHRQRQKDRFAEKCFESAYVNAQVETEKTESAGKEGTYGFKFEL